MKHLTVKQILILLLVIAVTAGVSFFIYQNKLQSAASYVKSYLSSSYKTERDFIVNIPIYRDYKTSSIERELTKFNLKAHAREVVKHGIPAMRNKEDIVKNFKSGKLVSVEAPKDRLYYFHNVKKEYRYLTPAALKGLQLISERFQEKLQNYNKGLPPVKLAVSSVIRTVNYQKKIFGRKFVSTHSFGGCFDIFFEDFFIDLPSYRSSDSAQSEIDKNLHKRMGFLMGDALRRQLRTVLSETLLELQRENLIYVFLENDNRCYHITILVK